MSKVSPTIENIVQNGLCTGCGICEGACLQSSIKMTVTNGVSIPSINKEVCNNNKGCHRCYDSCPGLGINLTELARTIYTDNGIAVNKMAGRYLRNWY